jgi:arginyl-tRNA synthetase
MFIDKLNFIVSKVLELDECEVSKYVLETPHFDYGDYTITILLQPQFKSNSEELFEKIKLELLKLPEIKEIKREGLFINVFVNVCSILNTDDSIEKENKTIMFEYPSPNSNKPLHLGHLRVITLGDSLSEIFFLRI